MHIQCGDKMAIAETANRNMAKTPENIIVPKYAEPLEERRCDALTRFAEVCNKKLVEVVYWTNGKPQTVQGRVTSFNPGDALALENVTGDVTAGGMIIPIIGKRAAISKVTLLEGESKREGFTNPFAHQQSKKHLNTEKKIEKAYADTYGDEGVNLKHKTKVSGEISFVNKQE